jgi:ATP-dependent RNA helicase DDX35
MTSPKTQIKYVTDGILLREATVHDPLLSSYSVVIVDEAHERTLQSDAILGLLKKIRKKRPELRIVVCSATIDAQAFLDYFIGKHPEREERKTRWGPKADEAPSQESAFLSKGTIISVDGRQYPVDVLYLAQAASDYVRATVETALEIHRTEGHHGDILCFLPSAERIDQAIREAEEAFYSVRQTVELLPLYGTLPYQMQARIFDTSPSSGARRIIFATNIAETSVT